MPAIIYKKNVEDLEGHEPFGSGECVALPQGVTEIGHTSRWYPGSRVLDLAYLNPGTVIANFVFSKPGVGRFPNRHGFHAGLFMHFGPRSMATGENVSIVAMDQWVGRVVAPRTINAYSAAEAKRKHIQACDNASDFYVVMV